jgi:large subunit ribosomal protein L6
MSASSSSMSASRVGRKPVTIPSGVEVKIQGQSLTIKGPKGTIEYPLHPFVEVVVEDGLIKVNLSSQKRYCRTGSGSRLRNSITGTTRANIANLVHGIAHAFEKKLLLVGVGYKAQAKGKILSLTLGFSHPVEFPVPDGISIETPIPTEILVKGTDKELVGLVASKIRAYRGPEPYKGKGVRYENEIIERKETKKK